MNFSCVLYHGSGLSLLLTTGLANVRNGEDDMLVRQAALEIESEYLKDEIQQLESSLSAKDEIEKKLKEKGKHRSSPRDLVLESISSLIKNVCFSSKVYFTCCLIAFAKKKIIGIYFCNNVTDHIYYNSHPTYIYQQT